jgi:hypothetical protein
MSHARFWVAAVFGLGGAALTSFAGDIPLVSIVRTGDPVPGSPGVNFTFFGTPALNATGTISFRSQTSQFGVFTGTAGGVIRRIAQGSDPAPDLPTGTTFALFDENIPINSHGDVAFTSIYNPAPSTSGHGAFTNTGNPFRSVILPGDPLVGHPTGGTFNSFGTNFNPVLLADNGMTAYNSWTSTFPTVASYGIWAGYTKADTIKVALSDDPAPTLGDGVFFDRVNYPVMNRAGTLAFQATVKGPATGFYDRDVIWAGTPGNVTPVVRSNSIAPGTGGLGTFSSFNQPDISATGRVAFHASLNSGAGIAFDQRDGIWQGPADRSAALTLVARSGTVAPGTGGAKFSSFFKDPLVNSAGTVSFVDQLSGTGITSDNGKGLWTGLNADNLTLVARAGDAAPGTPAGTVFSWSSSFDHVLNNLGQVAFLGTLTGSGVDFSNDNGIWVYDPHAGTRLVAREGQTLQISPTVTLTLRSVGLRIGASSGDGRATSLNDNGQIAFTAGFTTGIDYAELVADIGGVRPGDANLDGVVDSKDVTVVLANMNKAGTFASGDFNGDGLVDFSDYQLLEGNFGLKSPGLTPAPAGAIYLADGPGSVPEPGMPAMLVMAAGLWAGRRRRAASAAKDLARNVHATWR